MTRLINAAADDSAKDERIRILEARCEQLEASLATARRNRVKLPAAGKTRTSKSAFIRLFVPDTHGNHCDPLAVAAFLADLKLLNPREIFLMGDHLDCGGFLAEHHTLGFVADTDSTFEDDVSQCNQLLDSITTSCPKAAIKYLEGNHEERLERWCVTKSLRSKQDSEFLRRLVGPEAVLSLQKRNIPYIRKAKTYEGCRVQGTYKAGNCYVTHGTRHGKNAANQMLNRFGTNVVFGHVHKLMQAMDRNVKHGEVGAWCVGHLGRQQPLWRHGDPTDWTQGYGFQIVQPNGEFLMVLIPIIDGKSYLATLGKLLS
jgi:predicted phosphodiesterase